MKKNFIILVLGSTALFSSMGSFAGPNFGGGDDSRGGGWQGRNFDRPDDENRVRERRMREENALKVRQEIEQQEASLRAEEARLREMQETELLRREMESRGAQYESSGSRNSSSMQRPRDLKRKATSEPCQLDDQIVIVYSKLEIPETGSRPVVPLQKIRDGVYRFGTRNIFVDSWENGCGIAVRQGMNSTPFDEFVKKFHKTELLKIKGMACLGGFMGPGYV